MFNTFRPLGSSGVKHLTSPSDVKFVYFVSKLMLLAVYYLDFDMLVNVKLDVSW